MKRIIGCALLGSLSIGCADEEARKSIESLRQDLQKLDNKATTVQTVSNEAAAKLEKVTKRLEQVMDAEWVSIPVDMTGNEACATTGMSCLAVSPAKTYDAEDRFCGHTLFDCNARVYKIPGCATGKDYAVRPSRFVQQPGTKGACEHTGQLCIGVDAYQAALCTLRAGDELKGTPGPAGAGGAPSEPPATE